MDNFILDKQTDWRYCRVKAGDKKPYPADWQKNPLELHQVDSPNIGLLLGPTSGGTCAIDFDGYSAIDWALAQGIDLEHLPITPTWSSGKPGRCQMAFRVPQEAWDYLTTKKITHSQSSLIAQGEGFEFRWTGGQSVLPPSIHPTTGRPYEWWSDAMEPVADLPEDLLILWLSLITPTRPPSTLPEVKLEEVDEKKVAQVNELLEIVKGKHPVLAYDDWCKVSWGVAKELGREAGEVVMREYYPEQEPGEYRNIYRTYDVAKSPSMGTVRKIYAGIKSKREEGKEKYKEYLSRQQEIERLEQRIKEMKNGKQ
jgi:hypothetical protein